ncbi:MAG: hypothetical protein KA054_00440 [Candidatus Moranbacteria bacterium]|nr:hypothetical protein [Candidatus Moranbacteria bacterium]
MFNSPEHPGTTPSSEASLEQKLTQKIQQVSTIHNDIKLLCAKNGTAKKLFESADDMFGDDSIETCIDRLQWYLEDKDIDHKRKDSAVSGMVSRLINFYTELENQANNGDRALTQPLKTPKEELSDFINKIGA